MDNVRVIYDSTGSILLELGDFGLELTRPEAEQLFVDLGHAMQDQDIINYDENGETTLQP